MVFVETGGLCRINCRYTSVHILYDKLFAIRFRKGHIANNIEQQFASFER